MILFLICLIVFSIFEKLFINLSFNQVNSDESLKELGGVLYIWRWNL